MSIFYFIDISIFKGHKCKCKIAGTLVLITNRKLYMSFRLVLKSVTLNDLERRNNPYFALFHRFLYQSKVINTNLPRILHRFGDIHHSKGEKSLYLATHLAFKPPTEGFPWDDLRKNFPWKSMDGRYQTPKKKCRKF